MDGYTRFPENFYADNLIKSVHPDKDYTYWAFCKWPNYENGIIYSRGKKPQNLKLTPSTPFFGNLFTGCQPAMCFNYIIYEYLGKVGYLTSKDEFSKFLGQIDNIEEAVLLATSTKNLRVDFYDRKGGSYSVNGTAYNLRLMDYSSCPVKKESICIKIDKVKGIIQSTSLGIYYEDKNCIVY